jgi:hypothetical protein
VVLVPDFGFEQETHFFEQELGIQFALVNLHRNGTDWSADSRGWLIASQLLSSDNNGTPDAAARNIYRDLVRVLDWPLAPLA